MSCSLSSGSLDTLTIAGPGLLGGSLAKAVRELLPHVRVKLWGRRREVLEQALAGGVTHEIFTDIGEAVREADLLILATPVGVMPDLSAKLLPSLPVGCLVSDVGSVKKCVHRQVGSLFTAAGIDFIGSHPMAGSEHQGLDYAKADLFRGATCVLTNDEHVHEDRLLFLQRFWEAVGCHCLRMLSAEHDAVVARISHLPHILSALCVHGALDGGDETRLGLVSAGGFRDTTRVAMGEPSMWAEIVTENAPALLARIDEVIRQLADFRHNLAQGDSEALRDWLKQAAEARARALGL